MTLWHTFVDALRPWHLIVFAIVGFLVFYSIGRWANKHKQ